MKQTAFLLALALAGCAGFNTTQTDERKLTDGSYTKITTRVKSHTLFTSKSDLSKFRATQTEKSQGAEVGSLGQSSSGTNAVRALEALDSILGKIR